MADALSSEQLAAELASLPGWQLVDGKLHREIELADFSEAFAFMTRIALAAEKADHHPDWSNSWNRVVIDLVTHSAGGITELDVALARRIDELAGGPS